MTFVCLQGNKTEVQALFVIYCSIMDLFSVFLIAVGLSMDAFAVSICKGLAMNSFDKREANRLGLFFGGFQALMPLIGWAVCVRFAKYVMAFDHWIAFGLLLFIGGKMIFEALTAKEEVTMGVKTSYKELFILAIATSIDALAVGIAFAFEYETFMPVLYAVLLIGITSYLFSFGGAYIGKRFGNIFKNKAEIVGGIILIGIGVKILLEHLLG